jgi:hypothetical protein
MFNACMRHANIVLAGRALGCLNVSVVGLKVWLSHTCGCRMHTDATIHYIQSCAKGESGATGDMAC